MRKPQWVRSAVLYEINPRTFSSAGNLVGIRQQLDHLQQLGATVLWLMPIQPCGMEGRKGTLGSPYSIRDYYAIDPTFGNDAECRELVDAVHARGMRVILDVVLNHASRDCVLAGTNPEFFRRDADGKPVSSESAWSDVIAFDYSNPDLREYMFALLLHYRDRYGFDGFRCDIAHYIPVDFWDEARQRLGPDVFLLAEAEEPSLLRNAFDASYAWKFFHTLNSVFTEGASATRLRETWEQRRTQLPEGALEMRFTDNHDETRAIVRLGERATLAASAIVFLLDGIPLLYNGQEIGDTAESGPPALFDRVPIYWGNSERRPDFLRFYRQLIHLRRAHSALQQGSVEWTFNTDAGRVVSFFREGDQQEFLVTVNCSNRPFDGHVDGASSPVSLGPFGVLVRERKWGRMLEI
jgi:cyclomaltodextrinase / maltogenic alpha-amylase / neopullulanase